MIKVSLEYWAPKNESVKTKSGFSYFDTTSVVKKKEEINAENEIALFEKFYKMNNSLRYCNGTYYKFEDASVEIKYREWLKSDDFKAKSFNLFYGNGVVD